MRKVGFCGLLPFLSFRNSPTQPVSTLSLNSITESKPDLSNFILMYTTDHFYQERKIQNFFNKYLLSTYYVLDPLLHVSDTAANKTN